MTHKPKLTIIMPTYNREAYIRDALDSILMQECSYLYEIIIADDYSSDDSLYITKEYQSKHKDKIRILTSAHNQKLFKNISRVYADIKSEYFCVLDPDDFWIDRHKIQKAIDFLESHKDFSMYFGNTAYKYEVETHSQDPEQHFRDCKPRITDFAALLDKRRMFPHTSSVIYRNVVFCNGLPQQLLNVSADNEITFRGDTFRNVVHLQKGKAYYSGEVDSVYRIVSSGIWTSLSAYERVLINAMFWRDMWLYFDKKYPQFLLFSQKGYMRYSPTQFIAGEGELEIKRKISQCEELEATYKSHKHELEQIALQGANLKDRIFFTLYRVLGKKLRKKGFVNG
ncbi:glycosyltransferase family 2 protein [Helicobacter typhlonius]|uniref:glycosyltransferase family 2 protein n=1 Tax=Helicobacter typhlonius TaxID=76936 RepID=UPI002FE1CAC7